MKTSDIIILNIVSPLITGLVNGQMVQWFQHKISFGALPSHAFLFSAIESTVASIIFNSYFISTDNPFTGWFASHAISGTSLYAISYVAFKAGLLGSVLTLTGTGCLVLASAAISLGASVLLELIKADVQTKLSS